MKDMAEKNRTIIVSKLSDQGKDDDLKGKSPGELMGMVWELTRDALAFKGEPIATAGLHYPSP